MKMPSLFKDDAELESIRAEHKLLLQAEKNLADMPKKLRIEKMEQDRTMPPLADLEYREEIRRYEQAIASRKHYGNVMRAQSTSILLLFMLVLATAALIAWSIRLIQAA